MQEETQAKLAFFILDSSINYASFNHKYTKEIPILKLILFQTYDDDFLLKNSCSKPCRRSCIVWTLQSTRKRLKDGDTGLLSRKGTCETFR